MSACISVCEREKRYERKEIREEIVGLAGCKDFSKASVMLRVVFLKSDMVL